MASVEPPDVTYAPTLPHSLLRGVRGHPNPSQGWDHHEEGALSAAQLETVVYAGQRHAQSNADGSRCGFFLGDGTGVGKGRQIAAVILDSIGLGRYRHIWCSVSTTLLYDSRRDLNDLGRSNVPLHALHKLNYGEPPPEDGVMFCTYQSLIAKNKQAEARLDQLIAWAAAATGVEDATDFDGVLVFDEAHRAKNLQPSDARGKGSKTADAVLELQRRLPRARVLYVSATAAAEAKDLGYMTRLGLWGNGAPFRDFEVFSNAIGRAGVGAMELVAMDMKARGLFVARMLSFSGCSFEKRTCVLLAEERALYDRATRWWEELLKGFETCIQLTGCESSGRSFWGAHQAFFKQLLNSLKCRFAIEEAEAALDRGECVVIGLLSTGEAKANEAIERESRAGRDLESDVSTPQEIARDMLDRHLPVVRAGNGRVPKAELIRDQLMRSLEEIRMPGNALDLLISHFGVDEVAEMTGRKTRIVTRDGRTEPQSRAPRGVSHEQLNILEKTAFLDGSKRVAIISEAASSGISLHADYRFANTARRLHITLELAWSAEKMLQQFGRTHRSNQVSAPHYVLLVTDVGGEQRFASSVARKLESLGAMTRGDRRGGHGAAADLVTHNLDTPHGHAALAIMLDAVSEHAERDQLWERALRMLRCHRDGVPTLLGLCVVAVSQEYVSATDAASRCSGTPATKAAADKAAIVRARAAKIEAGILERLPNGLQQYIHKLQEWARPRIQAQASATRQRPTERQTYGACPRTPHSHGLTWIEAGDALRRMKLLNAQLLPVADGDRHNINKFLNRLLGLPVAMQNSLFAFFSAVFRWVVVSAKSQGQVDSGVAVIEGEAVHISSEPEIVFRDPRSSAASLIHAIRVDTGLSWRSACEHLRLALLNPSTKPTQLGGTTGFWRQARSNRIVLAVELPTTHTDRRHRVHRVLRPTLHTSAKPQYVPAAKLRQRYVCVRDTAEAEGIWSASYHEEEAARLQEVRLLCGAILPIWGPLCAALKGTSRGEFALSVKKCTVVETPLIGVALTADVVEVLRALLAAEDGGRAEDIAEAARSRAERHASAAARPKEGGLSLNRAAAALADAAEESSSDEEDVASTSLHFATKSRPPAENDDGGASDGGEVLLTLLGD